MPAILARPGHSVFGARRGIVVEALAVLAAEALLLDDHRLEQLLLQRDRPRSAPRSFLVACRIFQPRSIADFVVERQRPDRHAGHLRGVLDHRRRHALHQHQVAFADVVADAAVGVEAAAIVDDDRRLLDRADEVDRRRQRLRPVFSPMMISTSIILSTGEKKWTPMKFSGF